MRPKRAWTVVQFKRTESTNLHPLTTRKGIRKLGQGVPDRHIYVRQMPLNSLQDARESTPCADLLVALYDRLRPVCYT